LKFSVLRLSQELTCPAQEKTVIYSKQLENKEKLSANLFW